MVTPWPREGGKSPSVDMGGQTLRPTSLLSSREACLPGGSHGSDGTLPLLHHHAAELLAEVASAPQGHRRLPQNERLWEHPPRLSAEHAAPLTPGICRLLSSSLPDAALSEPHGHPTRETFPLGASLPPAGPVEADRRLWDLLGQMDPFLRAAPVLVQIPIRGNREPIASQLCSALGKLLPPPPNQLAPGSIRALLGPLAGRSGLCSSLCPTGARTGLLHPHPA